MKPNKPQFLTDYEKAVKDKPRCCHNCDNYDENGFCYIYREKPPVEFTQRKNVCETWIEGIPF